MTRREIIHSMRAIWAPLLLTLSMMAAPSSAAVGSAPEMGLLSRASARAMTASTEVQGYVAPAGYPEPFRISPDSGYVVWRAAPGVFSFRLPRGPFTQLSPEMTCLDEVGYHDWLVTDDSLTVLFVCKESEKASRVLWAVPIGGPASPAVVLSVLPDDPSGVNGLFSATSASRVFYNMSRLEPTRVELFSVPAEGPASASVVIHGGLGEYEGAWGPFPLQTSPGVVYVRWSSLPPGQEIWLADPVVPDPVPIGLSPPPYSSDSDFQVSPDELHLIWSATGPSVPPRIYSAPVSDPPGDPVQLNPELPATGFTSLQAISPDSTRVAFWAKPTTAAKFELFTVPIAGPSASAVNLSAVSLAWNPVLGLPQFSEDSGSILYIGDREVQGRRDLYGVPAAGPASANVRINPVVAPSGNVPRFELVPGTNDVVFPLLGPDPDTTLRCLRGSALGASGNATPLWTEFLRYSSFPITCRWLSESHGVLSVATDLAALSTGLWLAHGEGPVEPRPRELLDEAEFEPGQHPFQDPERLVVTPDGRYVVYIARPLGGQEGLWVLPLPFFWDGFESGGIGHWSAIQN